MKYYNSTRNNSLHFSPSECIIEGLSKDKGLFVPSNIEEIKFDIEELLPLNYNELAKKLLKAFFFDFTKEQLDFCVDNAYSKNTFEKESVIQLEDEGNFAFLELFHGKTLAFKDVALSILPYLISSAKENLNIKERIMILTATSGDTGKAALEGFKDVISTDVIVFYPYMGVSKLQLLQMLTQEGNNTASFAVRGNFDDTQTKVKEIFNDASYKEELKKKGILLSSANSINIGRLFPQVVYYYASYLSLVKENKIKLGEKVNFVVPTGNFGDILSGYYAKKTGLPINKLICASNDNNVLYDFFLTGIYDKNRNFKKTIAPSMDILISSNLERLVYHLLGNDDEKCSALMENLKENGKYEIDKIVFEGTDFYAEYSTEEEIKKAIKAAWDKYSYLMDTHTAAGFSSYEKYLNNTKDNTYSIILSTASPFKFSKDVFSSLTTEEMNLNDDVEYMYALSKKCNIEIPKAVESIEKRVRKEEKVIEKEEMKKAIEEYIKGKKL